VYVSFFGFREKPFNLTPDPKYLFLSSRHEEALAHLEYARRERGGFVLLTGEVGAGKTTVARHFLSGLDEQTATAVILYPALSASELLASVLKDLQVEVPQQASLKTLVDHLHAFLLRARTEDRDVVLLIDEAQDLAPEVLEQIRLISNLETDTEKLIQIILMGQPELVTLLARPDLRQLAQRVTARHHLTGLSRVETSDYVRHRLAVADGQGKVTFTAAALSAIYRLSKGIPRVINLLCDRALLAGYVEGRRTITVDHVRRAAREISGSPPAHAATVALRWAGVAAVAVLSCVLALAAAQWALSAWRTAQATPDPTPLESAPATESAPLAPVLLTLDRAASYQGAVGAVRAQWARPITLTALDSHLEQLRLLDLPAVLEMVHPARPDTCYIALLGLDGARATVATGPAAQAEVDVAEIEHYWSRHALVGWPEARAASPESWSPQAFARLGYSPDTPGEVARFQRSHDLVPDDTLGPRTLLALFSQIETVRPRLRWGMP